MQGIAKRRMRARGGTIEVIFTRNSMRKYFRFKDGTDPVW
jgi:hypothetical protein